MIKSHKELAEFIKGKNILHMNSLGKDSAVCLEWLAKYAKPKKIMSLAFNRLAGHPDDQLYMKWQAKRYPNVEFFEQNNGYEITTIAGGVYQSPLDVMTEFNKWEYDGFSWYLQAEDFMRRHGLEFMCVGHSRYESVSRATSFHKRGLVQGKKIYPIGLMGKKEIHSLIAKTGIKLHPSYRLAQSTFDYPSYYKMRKGFIANPKFREQVMAVYPMLALDQYRYEVLLNE